MIGPDACPCLSCHPVRSTADSRGQAPRRYRLREFLRPFDVDREVELRLEDAASPAVKELSATLERLARELAEASTGPRPIGLYERVALGAGLAVAGSGVAYLAGGLVGAVAFLGALPVAAAFLFWLWTLDNG